MNLAYAIIFVSDMNRSILFYRDIVGLPMKFASPGWTEFDTGVATIALHVTQNPSGHPADPEKEPAGHCRPGIHVPDINAFHQRMIEHNVRCIEQPRDQFGTRIAQYADPDGLAFSVAQACG